MQSSESYFGSYDMDDDADAMPIGIVVDAEPMYVAASERTVTPPPSLTTAGPVLRGVTPPPTAPSSSRQASQATAAAAPSLPPAPVAAVASDPAPRLSDGPTEALQVLLAEERRKLFRVMNEFDAARAVCGDLRKRIQQLEAALQDRERSLDLKQRQLGDTTAKCAELESQRDSIAEEAHRIVSQWQAEMERAQMECSRAVERSTRLEDELAVERTTHAMLKEAHRRAVDEAAASKSSAEAMLRDRATAQLSVADAAAERDRLFARLREWESSCEALRAKLAAAHEEVAQAKAEAQRSATVAAEAVAETARWKTDCLDAFTLAQQQRNLLAAETAAAAAAEARAREYGNSIDSLQAVTRQTREALATVDAERQRLERLVEDLTADKAELKSSLTKAEQVAKTYASAAQDQQEEFTLLASQFEARVAAAVAEREALASDKAELLRDAAGLQAALKELSDISVDADGRVAAAEEAAHRTAQEAVVAAATWATERSALEADIATLREEVQTATQEMVRGQALVAQLGEAAAASDAKAQADRATFDARIAELSHAMQLAAATEASLREKVDALTRENESQTQAAAAAASAASARQASLEVELTAARSEQASLKLEVDGLAAMRQSDLQRFQAAIADTGRRAAEEMADSHSRHAAEVQQLKLSLTTLTGELNRAHAQVAELQQRVDQTAAEVNSERGVRAQSVAEYERRLAEESDSASARIAAATSEAQHLKQQLEKVLRGHKDVSDELERVQEQWRSTADDRDAAREALATAERSLRQMEHRYSDVESRLSNAVSRADTAEARIVQIRSENAKAAAAAREELVLARQQYLEDISALKSTLAGTTSNLDSAKKSIADARVDRDAARQRIAELTSVNSELNRAVAAAEQKVNEVLKQKADAKAALAEWRTAAERQRGVAEELRAERDDVAADRDRVAAKYNALYEEKSSALGSSWKAQQEAQAKADTLLRQATELRSALAEQTTLTARNQRTMQSLAEANEALKASLTEAQRRLRTATASVAGHGSSTVVLSRTEMPLNVTEGPRRHPKRRSMSSAASAAAPPSSSASAPQTPVVVGEMPEQQPRRPQPLPSSRSESVASSSAGGGSQRAPASQLGRAAMAALAPADGNAQSTSGKHQPPLSQQQQPHHTAHGPMPTTHSIIL